MRFVVDAQLPPLLAFAALRALRRDGPAIVWMRIGNTTRDALLQIVRLTLPRIVDALERGEGVVEVTRE